MPRHCHRQTNTDILLVVIAQLVQDGQPLGEVCAGDSLLMSSGAAQCQADPGSGQAGWQLAALTLVLGVHQDSDSESDDASGPSLVGTVPAHKICWCVLND